VETRFSEMGRQELLEFYAQFFLNLPYCIEELMCLVKGTSGYDRWSADESPRSLEMLGAWFAERCRAGARFTDDVQGRHALDVSKFDDGRLLTREIRTLSLYVGMYYGEVAVKNDVNLRWEQRFGSKKLADYGQPLVMGGTAVPLNPVRVAHSMACGFINGTKTGCDLLGAYEYWASLAQKE